ncbi:AAA family ATPase [Veillonella caviae]|uniref:AAA family ATPase n=1 Tax=Veillonella caviae TaxID=248316 RepID=UPI00235269E7|nr:AAA family ATPase [Veillonella caviae]
MATVRLSRIDIENIKNVQSGSINLIQAVEKSSKMGFDEYKSAIESMAIKGIYGQNGSGKTACIDVLQILKYLLCGMPLPNEIADFIYIGKDSAKLSYDFKIVLGTYVVDIYYTVVIKRTENIVGNQGLSHSGYKTIVDKEVLSARIHSEGKTQRRVTFIHVNDSSVMIPDNKMKDLFGDTSYVAFDELEIDRKVTRASSRSFIFSSEFLSRILGDNKDNSIYKEVINELVGFGNKNLFVIPVSHTGLIYMNPFLPLEISIESEAGGGAAGTIPILLDKPNVLPLPLINYTKQVINSMNIVLKQIIPGLTISVRELGIEMTNEGVSGQRIEFLSEKNRQAIPFKYESDGIKKIVSILSLLISIYNRENVTVVIDELDAGIFEYLFGELLYILQEGGKGQLIFTSHNLRPLETLHKNNIAFTTSNPVNRYIAMTGVKSTNNLRDFYLREILVDGQNESVYQETSNARISYAFRKAGAK